MNGYVLKRLLSAVPVMIGVSLLSYLLLCIAPGDPAEILMRLQSGGVDPDRAAIEAFREEHGFNDPIYIQYGDWLNSVLKGDMGKSFRTGRPVWEEFIDRFPATIQLALAAEIFALIIAVPLGIISSGKHNSAIDHVIRFLALIGVSMPSFWLALLLILVFSMHLHWIPVLSFGSEKSLVLPVITLGVASAASLMRLTRASMLEVLRQNYIRTARAKGVKESSVVWNHAFRNAMIPVITIFGIYLGHLAGGTVIVETIFSWPGVGRFLVDSIYARDFPVIQGFVFIISLIYVLINLAVDIAYAGFDPRIRYDIPRWVR
ncbi:MAG: Nickel transporter permease NikB [Euryarchaeota archaeon]|nr:Nickel transporter permease NikB [Euryarchaeota archaeon]